MNHPTDERPLILKKRFWVGLFALAILGLIGGNLYLSFRETREVLAGIRDAQLPTTAEELDRFYAVPEGYPDTTQLWTTAVGAVEAVNQSVGRTFPDYQDLPVVGNGDQRIPVPGQPWDQLPAAEAWLQSASTALDLVHQAARAGGRVRFPIDLTAGINTLLPQIQQCRDAARLLTLHAHVNAHQGNFEVVRKDIIGMLRLSDIVAAEPVLVSQLVRIAVRSMAYDVVETLLWHSDWDDSELAELQAELAATDHRQSMVIALQGERALFFSALDDVTIGPFRGSNIRDGAQLFARIIDGLEESWLVGIAAADEVTADIRKRGTTSKLSQLKSIGVVMLMPATEQGLNAGARATARQRCADVAVAIRRHWLKTQQIVDDLSQLPPDLLGGDYDQSLPTDPFTGQPLRYQRTADGFKIYSVGIDKQDDGGDLERADGPADPKDVGLWVVTDPPRPEESSEARSDKDSETAAAEGAESQQ